MKPHLLIAILLTPILSIAPWHLTHLPAVAQPITPANAAPGGYALVEAKGEVFVHRVGDSSLRRVEVNAQIYPGDLVIVRKGAIAIVRCADGQNWTLPEGVSGVLNGCQFQTPRDPNVPSRVRGSTTPVDEKSPYIISPRQTALLDERPTLRWNPVPGANRYIVKVKSLSSDAKIWEMQVSSTEVVYAGSPLQRQMQYIVSVRAEMSDSSKSEYARNEYASFWLLDEQNARKARQRLDALARQQLSERARALAEAHIYSAYGLYAEAIEALEGFARRGNQTAGVYQLLGALYEQVGLSGQAGRYYSRARRQKAEGKKASAVSFVSFSN